MKRPLTLEQLLRLKRAEQPTPEFWGRFESELRAKQLAAIVAKRPWWSVFAPAMPVARRAVLPLGAAAAAVAAWTIAGHSFFQARMVSPLAAESPAPAVVAVAAPVANAPVELARVERPAQAAVAPAPVQGLAQIDESALPVVPAQASAPASDSGNRGGLTLSVRSFAGGLASLQPASFSIGAREPVTAFSQSIQPRSLSPRGRPIDPLARLTSPAEERRSRLLAETLSSPAFSAQLPSHADDRLVNALSNDRLSESDNISRYGLDAHSVSFKF